MPHHRLTKTYVDGLKPPGTKDGKATQEFHRDTTLPGFALRITSGGAFTYIVETRINGKVKRMTIGKHGAITTDQARKAAQKLIGEISLGSDPIAQKIAQRAKSVTLQKVYEDYLQTRKDLKPSTLKNYESCMRSGMGDWRDKAVADINRDMIEARHRKIGKTSPARANNTMRVLRALFNFAMEQYEDQSGHPVINNNPVNRISKTRGWYKIKRKQSLLKPHEIGPWFQASMQLNSETTRDFLHFLLFTGLRRGEASNLTWDDVDFKDRSFVIPETKNSEPHHLPFSSYIEELLKRRHLSAEKIWVFPSPVAKGPITEPRTALDRIEQLSGIDITCHDLRRTFITIAESLDIPAYSLKRLLNHKFSNDVTAGYIVPNTNRLRPSMEKISVRITLYIKQDDIEL